MIRWPDKDPSEDLIYSLDLTDLTGSDTIAGLSWAVSPAGPTIAGIAPPSNPAKVRIAGGAAGQTYVATCTATLSNAQTAEKSVMIKVRQI